MNTTRVAICIVFGVAGTAAAVRLSGVVTDRMGGGLQGIQVSLARTELASTTSADGTWSLPGSTTGSARRADASTFRWTGRAVELSLVSSSRVSIGAFDLRGRVVLEPSVLRLAEGSHAIPLSIAASGPVWLRVTVDDWSATRVVGERFSGLESGSRGAGRSWSVPDTLRFSRGSETILEIPLPGTDTSGIVVRIDTSTAIPWNDTVSTYGTLHDTRDGQVYRTVRIRSQRWMAENLQYAVDSSWCSGGVRDSCAKYGRLYKWNAAATLPDSCAAKACSTLVRARHRGVCPPGWHLPSQAENLELVNGFNDIGANVGGLYLKATEGWLLVTGGWYPTRKGMDSNGFRMLPGGYRSASGSFGGNGTSAYWWSSTEYRPTLARPIGVFRDADYSSGVEALKSEAYSVRCLQD